MVTWLDLAEEKEQLARAWTLRARELPPRLCRAFLHDAEDAVGQAKTFREAQEVNAPLSPGLAFFLGYRTEE